MMYISQVLELCSLINFNLEFCQKLTIFDYETSRTFAHQAFVANEKTVSLEVEKSQKSAKLDASKKLAYAIPRYYHMQKNCDWRSDKNFGKHTRSPFTKAEFLILKHNRNY